MLLRRFRVTEFRSVVDSEWIEVDSVTALIGTNESGKTNLLLPLWKLNPAREGEIDLLADLPRKRYAQMRDLKKPVFIQAEFELDEDLKNQIAQLAHVEVSEVSVARVSKDYDGMLYVSYPNELAKRKKASKPLKESIQATLESIRGLQGLKAETKIRDEIVAALDKCSENVAMVDTEIDSQSLGAVLQILKGPKLDSAPATSAIVPLFKQLLDELDEQLAVLKRPRPSENAEARKLVVSKIPSFVYYSNYGNLDSEIYLPHVIANLKRKDLGAKEQAKARTLKVLFEFVGLDPQEILELGQEITPANGDPTPAQIEDRAKKKKEREVLLQSASAALTREFRDWWRQGDYRFRLNADGNHFRIWVSDDRRPEEIELEGRSTGLQWFLSFFLVFLVESKEAHNNAILLLDEAGLSLHPLAQQDLSAFFESLSATNQIIYTTHSPFLVDPDQLDRVHAVYVDGDGATRVSQDLRAGEANPSKSQSVHAVHAALGLSVSDVLLQGCIPVIVEGPSDQYYFSAMKNYLIANGAIAPSREIVFIPAGGAKGINTVASIIAGKDGELPIVVFDADRLGLEAKKSILQGLYKEMAERVKTTEDICGMAGSEVEDLFPSAFMAGVVSRLLRGPEEDFSDVVEDGKPVVPQIEGFASKNGIKLEPGWKPKLAALVKKRLQQTSSIDRNDQKVAGWIRFFEEITGK